MTKLAADTIERMKAALDDDFEHGTGAGRHLSRWFAPANAAIDAGEMRRDDVAPPVRRDRQVR